MGSLEKVKQHVQDGLADREKYHGRQTAFKVICKNSPAMVSQYPTLSKRIRRIKEHSIANLDGYLAEAVAKLRQNGCTVYLADTTEEARQYILNLVGEKSLVVKSKSNVSKEMEIVPALEAKNNRVVETDLGDRICQLANCKPTHTMAPATHLAKEAVAEIFAKEMGYQGEAKIEKLVRTAREALRVDLLGANVGMSGANAIVAETGTIFLVENEGNIRAVTSLPPVHIVVAGINKVVPKLEDALGVLRGAASYGVGQNIGTYVSGISGPGWHVDEDGDEHCGYGPREVHVVLIDNGRHKAVAEGFGEAFYCINCGSCLNFCPIYHEIGDEYGYKYIGGIGVLQTAFMVGIDKAVDSGLPLCLSCKRCQKNCPNEINTPGMTSRLRAVAAKKQGFSGVDQQVLGALKRTSSTISLARTFQGLVLKNSK